MQIVIDQLSFMKQAYDLLTLTLVYVEPVTYVMANPRYERESRRVYHERCLVTQNEQSKTFFLIFPSIQI